MSGGGDNTTVQSTRVEYSPQEQAARDQVMQSALDTYKNSVASNNGQYTGAKPVGMSAQTQQGQSMLAGAAGQIQNNVNNATQANNFGLHDVLYANSNPYLQSAMDAATKPLINQFQDSGGVLSSIRDGAVSAGGYGGSRQGIAEGLAASRLNDTIANTRASMANTNYQNGLQTMQDSIKNTGMLSLLGQLPGQIMTGIGAQNEGYAQAQENYNAASRDYAQNSQWAPLQNLANIIYGGSNGTTTSKGTAPTPDNTGQILGGLGSMAMLALMMA